MAEPALDAVAVYVVELPGDAVPPLPVDAATGSGMPQNDWEFESALTVKM
jgi:hypothetical protein